MSWHKIHHLFIPHKDTHQKAHLISWHGLAAYVLIFIILQASFSLLGFLKPGILGISSNIQKEEVIRLTNVEREKLGLGQVSKNAALDSAAEAKARNMFEENYWAHFSPSGKDPWNFILSSGYKFSFAGENLAKNFTDSPSVITAWMNSSSHKENIVNSRYKDIGVAVMDGVLNGQHTTLVVQMFGTTETLATVPKASSIVSLSGQKYAVPPEQLEVNTPLVAALGTKGQQSGVLVDPFKISRSLGFSLISLVSVLLIIDFIILRRRGVFRISSHHLAHVAILSSAAVALLTARSGSIL